MTRCTPLLRALHILTASLLALCLLGVGLSVCAIPDTPTRILSTQFNLHTSSPFTSDELVNMALVTKDYTVGTHDYDELMQTQIAINASLQERTGALARSMPHLCEGTTAQARTDATIAAVLDSDATHPLTYEDIFAHTSERYTLDANAISHLDDVYEVFHVIQILYGLVVVAAFACMIVCARMDRAGLGTILAGTAWCVIGLFALAGVWACVDFNAMFNTLHSLFFTQGSWEFSWESLLISMYPPAFWMGMGVIWLITTLTCCTLCLIIGKLLKKHSMRHTDAC